MITRGDRIYNGLPTKLMNDIYDGLITRDETIVKRNWWPVISLYLARTCGSIEESTKSNKINNWRIPSKLKKKLDKEYNKIIKINPIVFKEIAQELGGGTNKK